MSTNRGVRGENRFYIPPPMRKLQQEREKKRKRLEAEEEKRKLAKENEMKPKSSNSAVREYLLDSIPVDLFIDILSRLPRKSIGRFRCVSKFWKSILGRLDFKELFLTRSSTRQRLFFVVQVNFDKELLVFSSPQPQNLNDNSSLYVTTTRYKSFPKYFPTRFVEISTPVCGLVLLQKWKRKARFICNPATGESITLPKVKATGIKYSYFGFDPVSKQFKVLCMTWSRYGTPNTHRILTLQTGKRKWRTVQDPLVPHRTSHEGICIDGFLYYKAYFEGEGSFKIVCFDFRFEKFSLINMDEDMLTDYRGYRLIFFNSKGKLGARKYKERGNEKLIALWVLEDAGKHKWSKRVCLLPPFWDNILKTKRYKIVGMTCTGEIVFTPYKLSRHFHIFYYNIESNTFTRVNIQGFGKFKDHPTIFTSLDYVESVQGFIT